MVTPSWALGYDALAMRSKILNDFHGILLRINIGRWKRRAVTADGSFISRPKPTHPLATNAPVAATSATNGIAVMIN
jgi:hypothetical protein